MNRHIFLFFLFSGFIFATSAQEEVKFLPTDWENPAIFEKGQTLPHAFHVPY
jgi:beta-galactosidase